MPRIIRNALYARLLRSPELGQFREDFETATGLRLGLVDEMGLGDGWAGADCALCKEILSTEGGRRLCWRERHALLEKATGAPAIMQCDAGLNEMAVPIRVSGLNVAFFVVGGTSPHPASPRDLHHAEHLLRKAGVPMDAGRLEHLAHKNRHVPVDLLEAWLRILSLAARQIALSVTARLVEPAEALPGGIAKACRIIRQQAFRENLNLRDTARQCAMSPGHLSRKFHQATGLTFREYLSRVRAERARELLLSSGKSITEVAFEAGFQSISQFHRVFRKVHGCSPREARNALPT